MRWQKHKIRSLGTDYPKCFIEYNTMGAKEKGMAAWEITTLEYDVPLERLFGRRLREAQAEGTLQPIPDGVQIRLIGEDALQRLAEATARVLLRDLQYLALARMTDDMPLSLIEKHRVLRDALALARGHEQCGPVSDALAAHLREQNALCLDGFLCFRMQDVLMLWQLCVEQATQKVLLEKAYDERIALLRTFAATQQTKMGTLQLWIHPDGSCTLSDDGRLQIEYADPSPEGVVSLLVQMAPRRLVIFDCSDGKQTALCQTLLEVFEGRAEIRT